MNGFHVPDTPIRLALVGAGQRSRTVYGPVIPWLKPWVDVVAVCDPVREHADSLAETIGARAYYSVRELVKDRPMEAALVVTPIPSHHSLSVFLSSNGIHNMCETKWTDLSSQARDMVRVASENRVIVRVAENFFRFPIDRIVKRIDAAQVIGPIHRIMCYNDHTGFHNNSRWIAFAGKHPVAVRSITHSMPTAAFHSTPERYHTEELYRARFFEFPDNLMVIDHASNIKGFLGRHSRPGYAEWQGERGTIVYAAISDQGWEGEGEVRVCTDELLLQGKGRRYDRYPIRMESSDGRWVRVLVELPSGTVEYENPFPTMPGDTGHSNRNWYDIPVAEHIADFALAVRSERSSEFTEQDALMSLMMDIGAEDSALHGGARVALPIESECEADRVAKERLREQFNVDPLDVEAMLALSFPKP